MKRAITAAYDPRSFHKRGEKCTKKCAYFAYALHREGKTTKGRGGGRKEGPGDRGRGGRGGRDNRGGGRGGNRRRGGRKHEPIGLGDAAKKANTLKEGLAAVASKKAAEKKPAPKPADNKDLDV